MIRKQFYFSQSAIDAFRAADYPLAIYYWQNAQSLTGDESYSANIKMAERLLEEEGNSARNKIKIAAIMDTFTEASFRPECELMQLYPDRWQEQLLEFKPAFVLIESAWRGVEGLWEKKICSPSVELTSLLEFCHEQELPTILWNKEDPPHFQEFFHLAKNVDLVFTVDADMIPRYSKLLGHDRVFLLPFFAQPRIFNPVEKYERQTKLCFAGSWTPNYPQRQKEFTNIVNALRNFPGVDIYDRNLGSGIASRIFPEMFRDMVRGNLPFDQIDRAYKGYRFGLNMNSVKCSSTMFARRCYELMASNTLVFSNYARGIRNIFGDLIF